MAFGRLERASNPTPMSDINMTPLIDVMLVLLVIFMITAPLMTSALKLDLPRTEGGSPTDTPQFIAVGLDASGQLFVGDERVSGEQLEARVKSTASSNREAEVHLRADQRVPYGRVAELIALVQKAGLNRIAFVTEPQPAK
jgi:biopolymer transport protein TolR